MVEQVIVSWDKDTAEEVADNFMRNLQRMGMKVTIIEHPTDKTLHVYKIEKE